VSGALSSDCCGALLKQEPGDLGQEGPENRYPKDCPPLRW